MSDRFRALVLEEADRKVSASIQELDDSRLPDGDVTVAISYSTLNYKDGMVLNGIGRLVRNYPHVPGIDFAGTVEASDSDAYKPGDKVVLTGWRVGEVHWGGYAGKARVKAGWLTPLPDGLSTKQAMAVGTAGFTSMLCVAALEDHLTPYDLTAKAYEEALEPKKFLRLPCAHFEAYTGDMFKMSAPVQRDWFKTHL